MAHASKQENPLSQNRKFNIPTFETFFEELQNFELSLGSYEAKKPVYGRYLNLYSGTEANGFFHPPALLS